MTENQSNPQALNAQDLNQKEINQNKKIYFLEKESQIKQNIKIHLNNELKDINEEMAKISAFENEINDLKQNIKNEKKKARKLLNEKINNKITLEQYENKNINNLMDLEFDMNDLKITIRCLKKHKKQFNKKDSHFKDMFKWCQFANFSAEYTTYENLKEIILNCLDCYFITLKYTNDEYKQHTTLKYITQIMERFDIYNENY
jgi:hypothetical protein